MATASDAELILKLYELRREEVMRKARHFLAVEFNPKTLDDLLAVTRGFGTEHNAYWRQVTSFWDMACALVLHGTIDAELFIDANGEPFFILGKLDHLRAAYQEKTGVVLMRQVAAVMEKYPRAAARYDAVVKNLHKK